MNLEDFLKTEVRAVDKALLNFLTIREKELAQINPQIKKLFQQFVEINKDGKRLRALLIKIGYQLAGGRELENILQPMLAVEIFHTAILAHDDIIDQSLLRRGKSTLHQALGNDHHAISQTIVLADYGLFLANQLIAQSDFEADKKNQALQKFNEIVLDTIVGEILDIELPYQKNIPQNKDSLTISLFKTARYTITGPLQIGAILAGADEKLLKQLASFGDNLGIAFQIQDDILGVFGSEEETGKSNLSDLEEGKVTLLASFAFKKGNPGQINKLKKLYGKPNLSNGEAEEIRNVFRESGALDMAYNCALEYTNSAIEVINSLDVDQEWKTLLQNLADFLLKRTK